MADFTDLIRQAVARNNYVMTHHARQRKGIREIEDREIAHAILHGEAIEHSPHAQPHPKCLFMYPVRADEPLYVACAYNARQNIAIIVTVHWYDSDKWIDWRTRKRR